MKALEKLQEKLALKLSFQKGRKNALNKVRDTLPKRPVKMDEVIDFAKRFIQEQGYKASNYELTDEGFFVIRILTQKGSAIGSVTIPPWAESLPMNQLIPTVKNEVLEVFAAAMQEPALRQEAV